MLHEQNHKICQNMGRGHSLVHESQRNTDAALDIWVPELFYGNTHHDSNNNRHDRPQDDEHAHPHAGLSELARSEDGMKYDEDTELEASHGSRMHAVDNDEHLYARQLTNFTTAIRRDAWAIDVQCKEIASLRSLLHGALACT